MVVRVPSPPQSHAERGENWEFWTGAGTSAAQREAEKPQLARVTLALALAGEESFWEHVNRVRANPSAAEEIARLYGKGKRRMPVTYLLRVAAQAEGDRDAATAKMVAGGFYTPTDPTGRRGTYRYRTDFRSTLHEGARLIARRGAGKCLVCGQSLSGRATSRGRSVRRDYCAPHEPRTRHEHALADHREHAIREVFRYAGPAVSSLALPPVRA